VNPVDPRVIDHAMDHLFPTPDRHASDPAAWVRDRLGEHLWSAQREIAASVVEHRHTAVPSCHASGKSHLASRLVAFWLMTRPDAFVVTTAPTWSQVASIIWRYVSELHAKSKLPGTITLDAQWRWSDGRLVALGRKPADDDQAAFQGLHARHLLVVIDEASGVPKALWDAAESLATNPAARILALGNPDSPASVFADVCAPGSGWNVIRVDAFSTPAFTGEKVPARLLELLVSPTWVEERRKRWGETSPLYVAKVLAEFPDSDENALISPTLIRAAQDRELPPGVDPGRYGCDIARSGRDETMIYRHHDGVVRLEHRSHGADLMQTTGEIARLLRANPKVSAIVDVIGLGAGVFDRLREQGLPVTAFNASERAWRPDKFANRRAEAWWATREAFIDGELDLDPDDDELAAQLGAVRFGIDSRGRILIEGKDQMRKRSLPSPDRADALVMAVAGARAWAGLTLSPAKATGVGAELDRRLGPAVPWRSGWGPLTEGLRDRPL